MKNELMSALSTSMQQQTQLLCQQNNDIMNMLSNLSHNNTQLLTNNTNMTPLTTHNNNTALTHNQAHSSSSNNQENMDQDILMPQPIERDPITQEPTHNTTFKKHKHKLPTLFSLWCPSEKDA